MAMLLVVAGAIVIHLMIVSSQFPTRLLVANRRWVDLGGLIASGWLVATVGSDHVTAVSAVAFCLFSIWLWLKSKRRK